MRLIIIGLVSLTFYMSTAVTAVTVDTLQISGLKHQVQLVQLQTDFQFDLKNNYQDDNRKGESIGQINNVEGVVLIVRFDGVTIPAVAEMQVFIGDIIKTTDNSVVIITFVDETIFALGEKGQMMVDELIYSSPDNEESAVFSVVQGVFSFLSGEIAKRGTDSMFVKLPVATIGIRGTKVAGRAAIKGRENYVTLLPEEDGSVGEISVQNSAGTQIMNQSFQTTRITSVFQIPTFPKIIPKGEVERLYGTVSQVVRPGTTTGTKAQRDNAGGANAGKAEDLGEEQVKKFDEKSNESNNIKEDQGGNTETDEDEYLENRDEEKVQSEEIRPNQGGENDLEGEEQEEPESTTDRELKDASSNQLFEYVCGFESLCDGGSPNWKGWVVITGIVIIFVGFIFIFVLLLP